jgi:hypothetical protein
MVLVYVIFVIMIAYEIPFSEICYLVNRNWQMVLLYRPNSWTAAWYSSAYLFMTLMFLSFKSQYKRSFYYVIQFQFYNIATHYISNANFKKTLTPCCDLPKHRTYTLYLFCIIYANSQVVTLSNPPDENFRFPNSQIQLPQADRIINSWNHSILCRHPLTQSKYIRGFDFMLEHQCFSVVMVILVTTDYLVTSIDATQ